MKRSAVLLSVIALVIGMASISFAGDSAQEMVVTEKAWFTAFLGSEESNPLHTPDDFCGEVIDGQLLLVPPIEAGLVTRSCAIPSGTEIVASPGGSFAEKPTDGKSNTALFSAALGYMQGFVPQSIKVKVDDAIAPKPLMSCTDPFVIPIEEGSFLPEIDDNVKGTSAKVSGCGWFWVVAPLTNGEHTVLLSSRFKGDKEPGQVLLEITVG